MSTRAFRRDGTMVVDNRVIQAKEKFTYQSVSNPAITHTTIRWVDGFVSCNCRGWATHKKCWHSGDAGIASAAVTFLTQERPSEAKVITLVTKEEKIIQHAGKTYRRLKFD